MNWTTSSGPEPGPVRGGHPRRRAPARRRGRRVAKTLRPHAPHRHLIKVHGVSPFEILAITFTNKAAGDEGAHRSAGRTGRGEDVGLDVPLGVRADPAPRRHPARLPSAFTIYDQADAVRLTGYVLRDLNIDPSGSRPVGARHHLGGQNDGLSAEDYLERASVIHERRIGEVFEEYQARLRKAGAMDFDDLLSVTVELLRTEPGARSPQPVRQRARRRVPGHQPGAERPGHAARRRAPQRCVVGDLDQCLVPGTLVPPDGERPIEDIRVGDRVLGTIGTAFAGAGDGDGHQGRSLRRPDRRGPRRGRTFCGDSAPHRAVALTAVDGTHPSTSCGWLRPVWLGQQSDGPEVIVRRCPPLLRCWTCSVTAKMLPAAVDHRTAWPSMGSTTGWHSSNWLMADRVHPDSRGFPRTSWMIGLITSRFPLCFGSGKNWCLARRVRTVAGHETAGGTTQALGLATSLAGGRHGHPSSHDGRRRRVTTRRCRTCVGA